MTLRIIFLQFTCTFNQCDSYFILFLKKTPKTKQQSKGSRWSTQSSFADIWFKLRNQEYQDCNNLVLLLFLTIYTDQSAVTSCPKVSHQACSADIYHCSGSRQLAPQCHECNIIAPTTGNVLSRAVLLFILSAFQGTPKQCVFGGPKQCRLHVWSRFFQPFSLK